MIVIGITGTLGAGKGTIVDYLLKNKGFKHYSVRAYIAEEITRRGLEVNRDTLTAVANDLRASHSPSYITDQLYLRAVEEGQNAVIESIRTPGEIQSLRQKGEFYLLPSMPTNKSDTTVFTCAVPRPTTSVSRLSR